MFFQNSKFIQLDSARECRLPAKTSYDSIGFLNLNDLLNPMWLNQDRDRSLS